MSGPFQVWVQVTQAIVRDEVDGRGWAATILRWIGKNEVPGYPTPRPDDIERSEEFKTTNTLIITGRVENGTIQLDRIMPPSHARLGNTKMIGLGVAGKCFVNRMSPYDQCVLGAIARPAAIVNGGRRLTIGSHIELVIRITGSSHATITPRISYSRFPTTFVWAGSVTPIHRRAEPVNHVLDACSSWR